MLLLVLYFLTACATPPTLQSRQQNAATLAATANWQALQLPAGKFTLAAYAPEAKPSNTLTVYIEGDGFAWVTSSQPSSDPTPINPMALKLAINQPSGVAAYLARPCQYVMSAACEKIYWTSHRFAPEVVAATSLGVDALKQRFHAQHLILVGYSGGGAVASLVAARRNDVVHLITVAGNLDHAVWTAQRRSSPLSGSLNAADEWQVLQNIPQIHFVGSNDRVINHEIAESYAARFPKNKQPTIRVLKGFDHDCCWVEHWVNLHLEALK